MIEKLTKPDAILPLGILCLVGFACRLAAGDAAPERVDFGYSPPEWQAAICLPDDAQKSLVDKSGALLYHWNQGGREFGTTVRVEVAGDAVWRKQELHSPRVPVVRTFLAAPGLEIVEEAFAEVSAGSRSRVLHRTDDGGWERNWAKPGEGIDPSLADIAVHFGGPLGFDVGQPQARVALVVCEGYWTEKGKRVQVMRVEGAEPKTVDTVGDIGTNKTAAFWFDGKDTDGDGKIRVVVEAAPQAVDKNTMLNGLWVFRAGEQTDEVTMLAGKSRVALDQLHGGEARRDLLLVKVTNTGSSERTVRPGLMVDTAMGMRVQDQRVIVNRREIVTSSLKISGSAEGKRVPLEAVTIPPGGSSEFVVTCGGDACDVAQAKRARDEAVKYWEGGANLPFGRIGVPDAGIQALVDSSIRNIWQAREIKNGLPAFQVGPTCYRGLWIVDGAFLLEAAALVGAGDQARNGVAYELTHQREDGRIEVMKEYSKENGIVLWTCVRHAQLTQDKAWLESIWPKLQGVARHIRKLREQALQNDTPLDDGLIPAGAVDGGLWGGRKPEFSNSHWNLLGLRAFVGAARWLGKTAEAGEWQRDYDDFMAAFRKAAARDIVADSHGNRYVPIMMANATENGRPGSELPQRGQWTFCHAVYPGQIFAKDDAVVASTLAMLEATEREGMVYGTGWDATGIWNYFASFYGHAWLWQGNGRKAAQVLYAYANHAAPVLVWREEQSLKGEPYKKVGDMPHNWASAEFIRLTVHLLALDRGDELHLFEGLPPQWTGPGMVTKLDGIATPFGKLTMELKVAADGKSARLNITPLSDRSCKKTVVHLGGWASQDPKAVIELDPTSEIDREIFLGRR